MIEAVGKRSMEHPAQYVLQVTRFLDRMIEEHGHYLFMAFALACFLFLVWMFTRRRKHPVHDVSVVILPLGSAPRREPEPEPVLFREDSNS
jgi:hypothetical protein